ncbi:hypothetical protein HMPREF9134_01806 [Porphyromonas catoniae F0037]|uniref:Uncharacterized protein n=1 Tax=Porphyromonas catoniae F0037 TaxID=1127696 RepID=L1N943_9PORP|nr:hypothetical protein HMPREF9134_01806 [Porphyromonas catoniae F0037]
MNGGGLSNGEPEMSLGHKLAGGREDCGQGEEVWTRGEGSCLA